MPMPMQPPSLPTPPVSAVTNTQAASTMKPGKRAKRVGPTVTSMSMSAKYLKMKKNMMMTTPAAATRSLLPLRPIIKPPHQHYLALCTPQVLFAYLRQLQQLHPGAPCEGRLLHADLLQ